MITIKPFKGKYKNGYIVDGHADSAEHGRDIVCASVSSITQMALIGILEHTKTRYIKRSGYLEVEIGSESIIANAFVKTMLTALLQLELQYSEYIKVEEE